MQKVLTAEQVREVDRLTTERYGIPSIILMENAAHAVARVITGKLGGSLKGKRILILCGKGDNGGDGAAVARILARQGTQQEVYLFGKISETSGDARINFDALKKLSCAELASDGELFFEEDPLLDYWVHKTGFETKDFDLIVDALFGTGLSRDLDRSYENVALACSREYRGEKTLLISIDVPSGVYSDRGDVPEIHFDPDITVTFTAFKVANVLPPVSALNGELILADIGSPTILIEEQVSSTFVSESKDVNKWLSYNSFSDSSYKNKRGNALVIAGSDSFSGAAVLCGNSAMRSGVGLVTIVTPKSSKDSVSSRVLPEVMVRGVAETENGAISEAAFDEIGDLLGKADAVAVGSGISQDESTRLFVRKVIERRTRPVIVDADALNLLSPVSTKWPAGTQSPELILTPHEGEFMRLLGTDDKNVIKDRVAAVRDFAIKNKVILVLKGERVLIGAPDGKVVVNPTGNSGLGKAGNGDTLTGILAGFVAQAVQFDIDIFETVVAAVYIAGMAGDVAEKKFGKRVMTASDVRECLTDVFANLERR